MTNLTNLPIFDDDYEVNRWEEVPQPKSLSLDRAKAYLKKHNIYATDRHSDFVWVPAAATNIRDTFRRVAKRDGLAYE